MPDFSSLPFFLLAALVMFLVVVGRYIAIAALFQFWFYRFRGEKWKSRNLGKKKVDKNQFYRELKWSAITSLIFAFAGAFTAILWQKGYTRIYMGLNDYPLWYLPLSLLISLLIHETYYYWLHRWMHQPMVFKLLHKVHHDSSTTSAWTAFSFHPLEGVLQAIILPLTIMFVPMHVYVLLFQLTLMTFSSVINHLEIETYPANFHRHFIGRWLIGATHHSLHHKQFKYNFGLYFTFWDKWKKTESPRFASLFEEKTNVFARDNRKE
ncbi:sterol desaturase family protein [Segetibacter sp.]|jgi:lathosterol oxidase|uniref:sterol desaturase family protein n=1 Tax=Segetibacter sp. TaxID=2231182 RepID=UPI002618985E|nr:sterol desaturase family protein [Segetibacter sp.]MCW3079986.1 sterol desaturase [Segetibacter sp.]